MVKFYAFLDVRAAIDTCDTPGLVSELCDVTTWPTEVREMAKRLGYVHPDRPDGVSLSRPGLGLLAVKNFDGLLRVPYQHGGILESLKAAVEKEKTVARKQQEYQQQKIDEIDRYLTSNFSSPPPARVQDVPASYDRLYDKATYEYALRVLRGRTPGETNNMYAHMITIVLGYTVEPDPGAQELVQAYQDDAQRERDAVTAAKNAQDVADLQSINWSCQSTQSTEVSQLLMLFSAGIPMYRRYMDYKLREYDGWRYEPADQRFYPLDNPPPKLAAFLESAGGQLPGG